MTRPDRTHATFRPTRSPNARALALAATLAAAALLSACGGGGSDGGTAQLSAADAQAAAANGLQGGDQGAASVDSVFDVTQDLVGASAGTLAAARAQAQAMSAVPQAVVPPVTVTVPCAGGGTASLTISGGTLLGQLNGQLDAGEQYALAFSSCAGPLGLVHLDGSLTMNVVSVDPGTGLVTAGLTFSALTWQELGYTSVLDGEATLARSAAVNGATTVATSHVTADRLSLATTWNGRSGSFAVTALDATRVTTWVGGVIAGSTLAGHHTLSGTANGRTIDETVSVQGTIQFDAAGTPTSGSWTTVRPDATVSTTVAAGVATITVDDGNDGTVDRSWTIPIALLMASAG